jgi:hypothetical protein
VKFVYQDGDMYEGEMNSDNKKEGWGVYYYTNNAGDRERYEGYWKNDMKEGMGTIFDNFNRVMYEGKWKDNVPHGYGILFHK